ncbi:MAG: 50S ribosomal protein L21 [Verrucomicrobia bacterium]|jgi:large subunit ribosomal protein L21|nr:50S ribosomal protein L21 [Verrucomicrobiota bacterium]
MEAYAVVETGGKQYRVQAGDSLEVEKLDAEVGSAFELDQVLAISDGESLTVGTPTLESVKVVSKVVDQKRGPKVINFKKKRRKGYTRKVGHRQSLTVLTIESIG